MDDLEFSNTTKAKRISILTFTTFNNQPRFLKPDLVLLPIIQIDFK